MSDCTLLRNGQIADGSGAPLFAGDVLLKDGVIASVGRGDAPSHAVVVDCTGLVIAPGFIDAHSHSDLQVLDGHREKLLQGVTSEVVGNCGFSAYPQGQHAEDLQAFANGIFCGGHSPWGWSSASEYLHATEADDAVATVYSLVGHGSLRIAVAGQRMDALSETEMSHAEDLLQQAFDEGAVGFSTGLMYAPGSVAGKDELQRLCRVVAKNNRIYTTHMRDYGFRVVEAVDEQIALAEATGCRLQISHLQAVGKANRDLNERALEHIDAAHARGVDIAFDCYPYIAGSTVMTQLLPQWALAGGTEALLERLRSREERDAIETEMLASIANTWDELLISAVASEQNAKLVGVSLEQIAAERGVRPCQAVMDVLLEEEGRVNILEFNQSEENLRRNLTHPLAVIISDGFYVEGRPHPRLHGTFPELLGALCRDRGWMPLETAIHKITGLPAERFRMKDRGLLREGYRADVTIFDPQRIQSRATYTDPEQSPVGVTHVFRGGRILLSQASPAA